MPISPLNSEATAGRAVSRRILLSVSKETMNHIRASLSEAACQSPRLCHGSLLLGMEISNPQAGNSFFIRKHVPIEWDTIRGGAPFLTPPQRRSLQEAVASWAGEEKVIGFCRTSRRSEWGDHPGAGVIVSELRQADAAILAACAANASAAVGIKFGSPPDFQPAPWAVWQDGSPVEDLEIKEAPAISERTQNAAAIPSGSAAYGNVPCFPPGLSPGVGSYAVGFSGKQSRGYAVLLWALGTILLSVLTYVAAHVYLKPALLRWAMQPQAEMAAPDSQNHAGLGLRIEENGTALELDWDPHSPSLQKAISATLMITESATVRRVPLDAEQLHSGRLVYTPRSGDVLFRLEAVDSLSHTFSESLHVLRNDVTAASATSPATAAAARQNGRAAAHVPGNHNIAGSSRFSGTHIPMLSAGATASTPPQGREITPVPAVPVRPQTVVPLSGNAPDLAIPMLHLPAVPIPLDAPPAAPPFPVSPDKPAALSHNGSQVASGRTVKPAVVISRSYPHLNRDSFITSAVVPVMVRIDAHGLVSSAWVSPEADHIPAYLREASINAARQWRFSAATIDGKAVPSEMKINFGFSKFHP